MASRKKRPTPDPKPPAIPASFPAPVPQPKTAAPALWWLDLLFGGILAGLAVFFLNLSWRKWPDPIIDFGRELYLPWRLTQGAALYRDMLHMYGPFSPYFNSVVFRLFGTSLNSIIAVNILIYAGILSLLYYILREGWSRFSAFVACVVFVSVFSFSHLVGIGNYNYITPYAHEATHGILIVLLLIWALIGVLAAGKRWQFFCAGLLVGLSILTKPETMLAAGAVSFGAILLSARERFRTVRAGWAAKLLLLLAGCLTPMIIAVVLFHVGAGFTWGEALWDVNSAWLNIFVYSSALSNPMQKSSMGTDNLWGNLGHETLAGGVALAFAFGAAWGCRYFPRWGATSAAFWAVFLIIVSLFVTATVPWLDIGPIIPALLVCAAVLQGIKLWRQPRPAAFDRETAFRALLWLAGAAFLFRMAFNPRIMHYGFFQAPLAMLIGLATVLVALPDFFSLNSAFRKVYQGILAVMILSGAGMVARQSANTLSLQQFPVGTGPDQFLAFDPRIDPQHIPASGALVEIARQYLAQDPGAHSLLVLPEGIMLNYLTRLPSTIPYYYFNPELFMNGKDQALIAQLKAAPPDRIVILSRNMEEYGVERFGDSRDHGAALLQFIQDYYKPVYQQGGDPLDNGQQGVVVFARQTTPGASPAKP